MRRIINMETVKTFLLQQRDPEGSGEWTDTGVAGPTLGYVKPLLKSFDRCSPQSEFRIVERTVITIYKTVKL